MLANPTPATVHARLVAYVDGLSGATRYDRIRLAAAALYVTPGTVYRWLHGTRRTPLWLENALNWLEHRKRCDAARERYLAEDRRVTEIASGSPRTGSMSFRPF